MTKTTARKREGLAFSWVDERRAMHVELTGWRTVATALVVALVLGAIAVTHLARPEATYGTARIHPDSNPVER